MYMGSLSQHSHSQQIVLVSLTAADCTSIADVDLQDLLRFEPVRQGKFSQLASSVAKVFRQSFTGFTSHVIGQLH
jgi:hypothetical protein